MLLSLVYFLVARLLGAGSRLQDEKDIELLVLRHQVKGVTVAREAPSTPPSRPGPVGGREQGR